LGNQLVLPKINTPLLRPVVLTKCRPSVLPYNHKCDITK